MRWLITGGCGFIGLNLLRELLGMDGEASVRILDNLSVGNRQDLSLVTDFAEVQALDLGKTAATVELVVGDVRDPQTVEEATRDVEVVVHLAAHTGVVPSVQNPVQDCEVNVIGTLNCLNAAKNAGVRRFIFASSGAPLGEQQPPLHEEMVPRPLSPYGASKLAGEAYCLAFHGSYGLGTVVLRFSNVYGPMSHRKESVVARFIKRALAGKPLVVYGDGTQTRDYLYVEDLVHCIIAAARSELAGQVLQVATGTETPLVELMTTLKQLLEPEVGQILVTHEPARSGEVIRSYADISKVREHLNWSAQTSLEEGLQRTVSRFPRQH